MRSSIISAVSALATGALAQTFATYTDPTTGIIFNSAGVTTTGTNSLNIGLAMPSDATQNEYIGRIQGAVTGWTGITHFPGMTNNLILMLWPNGNNIVHSFRYATGYVQPEVYTGTNANLTVIKSTVSAGNIEFIYRCQGCWSWDSPAGTGSFLPAATGVQPVGYAQATVAPLTPSDPASDFAQHLYDNILPVPIDGARNAKYSSWTALGAAKPTTTAAGPTSSTKPTGTATPTSKPASSSAAPSSTSASAPAATPTTCTKDPVLAANGTWDYIVVGAGAGGIPLAAKLAESGKQVLLIERGPPSSGRWGGTVKPTWLANTNLTRFDVPGLCNEIWVDSAGIACPDAPAMAGCVLGGGTAVNSGLWWKANPTDFDYNFPKGWQYSDVSPAVERVFQKIPWTDNPSMDGKLYLPQGYDLVGDALKAGGYAGITANDQPGSKNRTYSRVLEMFSHGERGGPMATYLVEATARKNFKLVMNQMVARVVRTGSTITGVQLECGQTINVNPGGKVILSSGVFGTTKLLLRSGIGPTDQLTVVAGSTDGAKMIAKNQWINLPVGYNLNDHVNTDTVVSVPGSVFYDFYAAFNTPIAADSSAYLNKRSGILAQAAPNIAPVFWEEIKGSDGIVRQFQYTSRVEASGTFTNPGYMTISQYLGRGSTSRGRLTITSGLNTVVSTVPYLQTKEDLAAVTQGIKNLRATLAGNSAVTLVSPAANQTVEDFLTAIPLTTSKRSANHWIGTAKLGTDSGLTGGTSVVDLNTKVYGTDNLFVMDASIFPGMMSNNPSALIVAAAEHASEKILALGLTPPKSSVTPLPADQPTTNSTQPDKAPANPAEVPSTTGTGSSGSAPVGTGSAGSSKKAALPEGVTADSLTTWFPELLSDYYGSSNSKRSARRHSRDILHA